MGKKLCLTLGAVLIGSGLLQAQEGINKKEAPPASDRKASEKGVKESLQNGEGKKLGLVGGQERKGPCDHAAKEFAAAHKHEGKCSKECEGLKHRIAQKYAGGCRDCSGGEKPVVKRPEGDRPEGGGPCKHAVRDFEVAHKHEGKCSGECEGFKKRILKDYAGCLECKAGDGKRPQPPSKEGDFKRPAPPNKDGEIKRYAPEKGGGGDARGGPKGNNGVGNGVDPAPPGKAPVNDGPGTGPGNPGAKGGPR
jgi:hypothetical protein